MSLYSTADRQYHGVLRDILDGDSYHTRNSFVRRSTLMNARFRKTPLITTRRTAWKTALREMEWFLSGSNRVADLHLSVQKWWEPWANENGVIPNNYSVQFRAYAGASYNDSLQTDFCDQIEYLVDALTDHPYSRRAVISTWNTTDMVNPATPITNCHGTIIQCFVNLDDTLDMFMYQRSADMIVGVPHNWIQYWAFLLYLASRSGRKPGALSWLGGDCHIYGDHLSLAARIVEQEPAPPPNLVYTPTSEEFLADDFSLDGPYEPSLNESAKMVV